MREKMNPIYEIATKAFGKITPDFVMNKDALRLKHGDNQETLDLDEPS